MYKMEALLHVRKVVFGFSVLTVVVGLKEGCQQLAPPSRAPLAPGGGGFT